MKPIQITKRRGKISDSVLLEKTLFQCFENLSKALQQLKDTIITIHAFVMNLPVVNFFYAPGLKGPLGASSVWIAVFLSVRLSVRNLNLKFGWSYSNQTWTVSSWKGCSHFTGIPCPWGGMGSKCRTWRFLPYYHFDFVAAGSSMFHKHMSCCTLKLKENLYLELEVQIILPSTILWLCSFYSGNTSKFHVNKLLVTLNSKKYTFYRVIYPLFQMCFKIDMETD